MQGCIAVLNAGSSSIKFAVYADAAAQPLLLRGQVQQIGVAPNLRVTDAEGTTIATRTWPAQGFDHRAATENILTTVRGLIKDIQVRGVGHRVVHGGTEYAAPVRLDAGVLAALARLVPLAPLHQPHNLAPIHAIAEHAPALPQVACFDTAFHRGQDRVAQLFALPRRLTDAGIRRYGFHGLSYEYIVSQLREIAPDLATGRVVIAHLGNGASLCAVHQGRSVASTMGFTAVDGLMMGTRCGAIDPGVLLYLMDEHAMGPREIEDLIYRRSGLLGVSGISSDMRVLRATPDPAAAEAIGLFIYRIVCGIGALAAAMGGIDGLIFTAGIGEHDAATRAEVVAGCAWLGLKLDEGRNASADGLISAAGSRVSAWIIPTDEEHMIARHTAALLGEGSPGADG